jgi:hypothetical protein
LLDHFWFKKIGLPGFGVRRFSPGLVTPQFGHPVDPALRHLLRIAPDGVAIDVHDGEVKKHVDRLRLSRLPDHIPNEVEPVRIEEAQRAVEILVLDRRQ